MQRNIELIQTISEYKRKGENYPRTKKQKPHKAVPYSHCKKFAEDPQRFFSQKLCPNIYKALNLKPRHKRMRSAPSSKVREFILDDSLSNKTTTDFSKDSEKAKQNNIIYNMKKYFEEVSIDRDDDGRFNEH